MVTDTVQTPETDRLTIAVAEDAGAASFDKEEINIIAFRLWQRTNEFEMIADDCGFCKGETLKCLAVCR